MDIKVGEIYYINRGFYRGLPAKVLTVQGKSCYVNIATANGVIYHYQATSSLSKKLRKESEMGTHLTQYLT